MMWSFPMVRTAYYINSIAFSLFCTCSLRSLHWNDSHFTRLIHQLRLWVVLFDLYSGNDSSSSSNTLFISVTATAHLFLSLCHLWMCTILWRVWLSVHWSAQHRKHTDWWTIVCNNSFWNLGHIQTFWIYFIGIGVISSLPMDPYIVVFRCECIVPNKPISFHSTAPCIGVRVRVCAMHNVHGWFVSQMSSYFLHKKTIQCVFVVLVHNSIYFETLLLLVRAFPLFFFVHSFRFVLFQSIGICRRCICT